MKNLFARILTAVVLLPIVVLSFIKGGAYLSILLALAGIISSLEIAMIIVPKNIFAKIIALFSWLFIFVASTCSPNPIVAIGLAFFVLLLCQSFILFAPVDRAQFEKFSATIFWSLYVVFGISCVQWLVNSPSLLNPSAGLSMVLIACVATWSNDTFAYFGGLAFGRHQLCKSVSSKKTWEGFFVGATLSVIIPLLIKLVPPIFGFSDWLVDLSLWDVLWISLPVTILAPLGDLFESRLKRFYEVKDSSKILPGHGGILDRIDSLLLVLPWTTTYAFIIRSLW